MNPSGGFIKPSNKIIGEDGQTEYFTEEQMEQNWRRIYNSMPYIEPIPKFTDEQIERMKESFCEYLKQMCFKMYLEKENPNAPTI